MNFSQKRKINYHVCVFACFIEWKRDNFFFFFFLKNELKKKLYLNNSGDFKEMEKKIKNKIIKKKKEGS